MTVIIQPTASEVGHILYAVKDADIGGYLELADNRKHRISEHIELYHLLRTSEPNGIKSPDGISILASKFLKTFDSEYFVLESVLPASTGSAYIKCSTDPIPLNYRPAAPDQPSTGTTTYEGSDI